MKTLNDIFPTEKQKVFEALFEQHVFNDIVHKIPDTGRKREAYREVLKAYTYLNLIQVILDSEEIPFTDRESRSRFMGMGKKTVINFDPSSLKKFIDESLSDISKGRSLVRSLLSGFSVDERQADQAAGAVERKKEDLKKLIQLVKDEAVIKYAATFFSNSVPEERESAASKREARKIFARIDENVQSIINMTLPERNIAAALR